MLSCVAGPSILSLLFYFIFYLDPDNLSGTEKKLIQQFGGDARRISREGNEAYSKDVMNIIGKVSRLSNCEMMVCCFE